MPVNMHDVWRSFELNSSLHSNKFKVVMLDLFKQGEILAESTVSRFTTDKEREGFYTCQDLLAEKYPGYKFDQI